MSSKGRPLGRVQFGGDAHELLGPGLVFRHHLWKPRDMLFEVRTHFVGFTQMNRSTDSPRC